MLPSDAAACHTLGLQDQPPAAPSFFSLGCDLWPASRGPAATQTTTRIHPVLDTVPVILKRLEGGHLGPQGEFHPEMPTSDRLTEICGGE